MKSHAMPGYRWKLDLRGLERFQPSGPFQEPSQCIEVYEHYKRLEHVAVRVRASRFNHTLLDQAHALPAMPDAMAPNHSEFTPDPEALARYPTKLAEDLESLHN